VADSHQIEPFSVGKVMLNGCGPQECAEVLQSSAVILPLYMWEKWTDPIVWWKLWIHECDPH